MLVPPKPYKQPEVPQQDDEERTHNYSTHKWHCEDVTARSKPVIKCTVCGYDLSGPGLGPSHRLPSCDEVKMETALE